MIQSVNNKKIKEYAKLIQKKERDKTNLFLVEGEHMVKEAFNANALQELFILEGLECPIEFNYETVTQQVLNKLSNQNSNSKMIGVCKKLNLKPEKENSILLLDNVQDPGNVGTILRTAHSFDGSLTLAHSRNSQMSFMYGFFFRQIFALYCCMCCNCDIIVVKDGCFYETVL